MKFESAFYWFRQAVVALLCVTAVGCTSYPLKDAQPDDPAFAPVTLDSEPVKPLSQGSLYRSSQNLTLFDDRRAYRVGDIITVLLNERTVSSKSTETSVSKNSAIDIGDDNILGRVVDFKGHSLLTGVDQGRSFDGSGDADQQNSLSGSIAVTVAEVMPNGLLSIRGEKWMTLTTGREFIRVAGLIRPEDVSFTNSISSTKVANARISYSGTGELADASRQGWGSRFFNSVFWPF